MEFRILGPLEVFDEEDRVAVRGAKQKALLALLVIHANETLSTERLIDELPHAASATDAAIHTRAVHRTASLPHE